jgi:Protein of unknown function (DUF2799)
MALRTASMFSPALRRALAVFMLAGVLAGCETLSEDQCRTGDWNQIGYQDGSVGRTRDVIAQHEKACAKIGIKPNANLWYAGYERGIPAYCTPQNGLEQGMRDSSYQGVCPPHLEPAFLARYSAGREVYKARQVVEQIDRDINSLERDLGAKDLKPDRRADIMNRLHYQRMTRMNAATQVAQMEAWARGVYTPPLAPIYVRPPR